MLFKLFRLFSLFLLIVVSRVCWAEGTELIFTGKKSDVAIKGYDVVAYFVDGKAKKGNNEFSESYQGARWYFASAENLEAFKSDPEKFMPEFGGYCAYGASKNKLVKVNPEHFLIHDGKLYLSYNKSVKKRFSKDIEGYLDKAEKNWPGIVEKEK